MGSAGLMLLGAVGDKHLDDPSMEPVWRTVAELDMPVAVHPGFPCPALDNPFNTVFDCVTVSFVFSQLIGFHTIMRSGLLDRYPNLRVGFMENGARWVRLSSPAHRGELRQERGADHWRQARSQHARGCHRGLRHDEAQRLHL